MTTLLVHKLPNDGYVQLNCAVCNPKQFHKEIKYVSILLEQGRLMVKLEQSDSVEFGKIGLSAIYRNKYKWSFQTTLIVEPIQNRSTSAVKIMEIEMIPYTVNDKIYTHEEIINTEIIKKYKYSLVMSIGGIYYLEIGDNKCFFKIVTMDLPFGLIKPETVITISNNAENIMIASKKSRISKKFFEDDFDFTSLGVGGLDKEFSNIFRRAFATWGISSLIVEKLGIKHERGILLYGPPGCGKTAIARALATKLTNKPAKIINGPEVLNKYIGESEKNVREIFKEAIQAFNNNEPDLHVIILDEFDAICPKRSSSSDARTSTTNSLVNQFLTMIDGVDSPNNFIIIAMTNRKELIDEAIIREGRIGIHIHIGLPDEEGRLNILKIHTAKMAFNQILGKNVDFLLLAQMLENYTGSEIEAVVKNASSRAISQILKDKNYDENADLELIVDQSHFLAALSEITPTFGRHVYFDKEIPANNLHLNTYNNFKLDVEKHLNFNRINSAIFYGLPNVGKSTFMVRYAREINFNYVRYIPTSEIIEMNEIQKSSFLLNIVDQASQINNGCIIIDDLEIVIDYIDFGGIRISNKMYQTILSILKTILDNTKLILLVSTSEIDLYTKFGSYFNMRYMLE